MMLSTQAARMGSVRTTIRKFIDRHPPPRSFLTPRFKSSSFAASVLTDSDDSDEEREQATSFRRPTKLASPTSVTLEQKQKQLRSVHQEQQQQQQQQPWMINLDRDPETDSMLRQSQRPDWWFTGRAPSDESCPGLTDQALRSLPLPNLSAVTRQAAREYFDNSWTLYETLFAGLCGEEGFYRPPPHGLRHPQIFYYGHTACLYVNKLRVAGVLDKPVNAYFESIFEVGVDEMLWDDMHKNDMLWPTVAEVHEYRHKVYKTVVDAIANHPSLEKNPCVDQSHPMWALFMGFEHERIHLETSSVLFRETPLHLVHPPANWPPVHPSARQDTPTTCPVEGVDYPSNPMVAVNHATQVDLGKPAAFPSFGWDNEYGERKVNVPNFEASRHMITNGEYWQFVADGGYRQEEWWCDDGWAWRTHRNLKWPFFWNPAGPAGSHEYRLRTIFEVVSMPWSWPVDVNYYEAKAYCRWKTAQDGGGKEYRLLTEAEHHLLRPEEHNLPAARRDVNADKVMLTAGANFPAGKTGANLNMSYGSQNPVDFFPPSQTGHHDVTGSAWEWTEDHFNPLKGFEVHHVYDDFSTPCFDGKHSMIVGGSFMSTGDEASVFARFHFRPHFLQHSGFRLVASDNEAPAKHLYANFAGQAAATVQSKQPGNNEEADNEHHESNVYETDDSLHMYLGLHYPESGQQENVPPIIGHANSPDHGVAFPQRVANLMTGLVTGPKHRALDVGCAVGGSSFALAESFDEVDAFDFSASFVKAARQMQSGETMSFKVPVEAELYETVEAVSSTSPSVRQKVRFFTGDACRLREMADEGTLQTYDGVTMANLLCRLPDPEACLDGLPFIVKPGGVVVMVTPFSWLTEFTPRSKWLGGFNDPVSKEPIHSKDMLKSIMERNGFEKIHEEQMPLVIREHQRKYQYIVSEATGWRREQ